MNDRIEKRIELNAPVSRVWRALTDHHEFGTWFRISLDGPFAPGKVTRGKLLYPGYEHVTLAMATETIEPETYFAYRWHPHAIDMSADYSREPMTLVEFRLTPKDGGGTVLAVTESGFASIPAHRRDEAFLRNGNGWAIQLENIARYVTHSA